MNNEEESIKQMFLSTGEIVGGLLLIRKEDAIKFAHEVRKRGKKIIGFDGFISFNGLFQSSLDKSDDFSSLKTDGVDEFIKNVSKELDNVYYDIVLN